VKRLILLLILTLLILLPISAAGQDHHSYFLVKPGVYYFAGDLEAEHPRVGSWVKLAMDIDSIGIFPSKVKLVICTVV
jgi:hypothetical protein